MSCDCIKELEEKLKVKFGDTARVHPNISMDFNSGKVESRWTNLEMSYTKTKTDGTPYKKKTTHPIIPTYCPLCGEKYKKD